jgi:hypothetical protein
MVLMSERGPKEGHNAIAQRLVHRPLIAVHGFHHPLQHRVEHRSRFLGISVGRQLHRGFQVGKQHRDLLTLSFQGTLRGQDLLRQMLRGIAMRGLERHGGLRWWLPGERRAAFGTELGPGDIISAATGAAGRQRAATLDAELAPLGILRPAVRAAHRWALRHSRGSGRGHMGRSPGACP